MEPNQPKPESKLKSMRERHLSITGKMAQSLRKDFMFFKHGSRWNGINITDNYLGTSLEFHLQMLFQQGWRVLESNVAKWERRCSENQKPEIYS